MADGMTDGMTGSTVSSDKHDGHSVFAEGPWDEFEISWCQTCDVRIYSSEEAAGEVLEATS
jgi:hypothetical protein